MHGVKNRINRTTVLLSVVVLVVSAIAPIVIPARASAAQITSRSLAISNSAGGATGATYTFNFTVPTATVLQSVAIEMCTTSSGACTTPSGFSNASSTLASQPTNLGDASGWTVSNVVAGSLRLSKNGNVAAPTGSQTITFGNVTNLTAQNTAFFGRITTYSGASWTGAVDTGTVANSTAQAISLSASVAETLSFCTGTSGITNTSCSGATGSAVSLGGLNSSSTGSGTSQFGVGTNASSGYAVTVNGTTLTSGANTITTLATQAASSSGTEQFGLNLRDNATPNIGADPDGAGAGSYSAFYGTANQYRFVTGDVVASYNAADNFKLFTTSYIANITTATEAGTYTATMTYICTPTF